MHQTALQPIRIQSLAQMAGAQGQDLSLVHDRCQHLVIWITRGQGKALLNGTRRGLGVHNALTIPAGALFSLEMGRQSTGFVAIIPNGSGIRLPEEPRQLRLRDASAISEFSSIFEAAQREAQQSLPLSQDALDAHVSLMSVWLRRQMATPEHLPHSKTAAERISAAFCERVSKYYAHGLTISEHAQALGISSAHLSRVCKSATGRTAAELLTERVFYAARQSLQDTRVPIQDIARHLGFGSPAYFTRFIQQHAGVTPSTMRKRSIPRVSAAG